MPKQLLEDRLPAVIKRLGKVITEEHPQNQIFRVNLAGDREMTIKVPLDDIIYFETLNRITYLHTRTKTYVLHCCKFIDLIEHYNSLGFVEIYRACIVNLKYIFSIDDAEIRLDNGITLPLSRRKRHQVLEKFVDVISEVNRCQE